MSKMGQIHEMAMNEETEELEEYLELLGWRPGASSEGAKHFIEAAREIKEKEEKLLFNNMEESDSIKL